jgi:hypothetical protein
MTELIPARDSIPLEQILLHSWRNGYNGIGSFRENPLDQNENANNGGSEIALKHMSVVSVDEACPQSATRCQVVSETRQSTQGPRFCHVSVDDVRLELLEGPKDLPERLKIFPRCDGSDELVHINSFRRVLGKPLRHVALIWGKMTVNQAGFEAARYKLVTEIYCLDRGSANVQSGDDSSDPDSRVAWSRFSW